jgi:hypothetical protein
MNPLGDRRTLQVDASGSAKIFDIFPVALTVLTLQAQRLLHILMIALLFLRSGL